MLGSLKKKNLHKMQAFLFQVENQIYLNLWAETKLKILDF